MTLLQPHKCSSPTGVGHTPNFIRSRCEVGKVGGWRQPFNLWGVPRQQSPAFSWPRMVLVPIKRLDMLESKKETEMSRQELPTPPGLVTQLSLSEGQDPPPLAG